MQGYLRIAPSLPRSARKFFRSHFAPNLRSLQTFVCGGAPLDESLESFWRGFGMEILQGYGLTEASPILTTNTSLNHKPGSVGKPLPNMAIHIRDDGEILAKGENITPGYFENKEATKEAFSDGWFITGDIGKIDGDGFLFITGRRKNMIVTSSGLKVYPEDIEAKLHRFPQVFESVVLGVPKNNDVEITAVVLLHQKIEADILMHQTNQLLASHQQIHRMIIWPDDDFPRTPTRKIIRAKVLEQVLAEKSANKKTETETNDQVLHMLSLLSGESALKIHEDSLLVNDLRLDSLKRLELLSQIETNYNSIIDEMNINQKTTVSDLRKLITDGTGKSAPHIDIVSWPTRQLAQNVRAVLQTFLFFFLKQIQTLTVSGKDVVKSPTPVIYIANHASHLDTPTVLRALPKEIRNHLVVAAAKDYFFNTKLKSGLSRLVIHAFPVDRESHIQETLELCGKYLDRGYALLIYPEGTRSTDGKLHTFKDGIGILAQEMAVPIVPIVINGTYAMMPKGQNKPKSGMVSIQFGEPLYPPAGLSYTETSNYLEQHMKELLYAE